MTRSVVFQYLLAQEFNKYLVLMYNFRQGFDLEVISATMNLSGFFQLLLECWANMESFHIVRNIHLYPVKYS